jgi:hypothetical protein
MLKADLKPITRKWAIVLILLSILKIAIPFIAYFQVKYQLTSSFVPETAVLDITNPYMVDGLISTLLAALAFGFYVYSKFTFTIITCLFSLVIVRFF